MTPAPAWTSVQLAEAAALSAAHFRSSRLDATTDAWGNHFAESEAKFESLFRQLADLTEGSVTDASLGDAYKGNLGEALRYLAGPPISDDDLIVIADIPSVTPSILAKNPAEMRKAFEVIRRVIDPHRFPWVRERRAPTPEERRAALLASAVLLAAQRMETDRRSQSKRSQESAVAAYLAMIGFREVPPGPINTIVKGPQLGEFCNECLLGERKADVVLRLHDTRLMAIECKVSNSATNSVKRLNNDAAVKARYWLGQFGSSQVVPAAVLSGVFKLKNLEQAQASGLALFWAHDLEPLGHFVDSTREP